MALQGPMVGLHLEGLSMEIHLKVTATLLDRLTFQLNHCAVQRPSSQLTVITSDLLLLDSFQVTNTSDFCNLSFW